MAGRNDDDACTATALALGTRYNKRIGGHVLNVLSSVVMPIHKIDYDDEDHVPETTPCYRGLVARPHPRHEVGILRCRGRCI